MRNLICLAGLLCGALVAVSTSAAEEAEANRPASAVVELFTSQGCYSCPPADALLGELIDRHDSVVALEYHVDYWDDLVYGSAGSWRDPFSSAAHTKRQRDYQARGLAGRSGVYTPQMVVNGAHALVGSNRDALFRELRNARRLPLDVTVRPIDDAFEINIRTNAAYRGPADVMAVELLRSARTPVRGGENHGKMLKNHNIVTNMRHIGRWWGNSPAFRLDAPEHDETRCAVLVQEPSGRIVGAAYCPSRMRGS